MWEKDDWQKFIQIVDIVKLCMRVMGVDAGWQPTIQLWWQERRRRYRKMHVATKQSWIVYAQVRMMDGIGSVYLGRQRRYSWKFHVPELTHMLGISYLALPFELLLCIIITIITPRHHQYSDYVSILIHILASRSSIVFWCQLTTSLFRPSVPYSYSSS